MAYLHCHSCEWSQDDFWTKRYNPLSLLIEDFGRLVRKPYFFEMDSWALNEVSRSCKIPIFMYRGKIHSWNWFFVEASLIMRAAKNMTWYTEKQWERCRETAVCPNCGNQNFDID